MAGKDEGSNYVDGLTFVAPGIDIITTSWYNTYEIKGGTSFASPLAAGITALMLSANPGLTADEVWMIMRKTARERQSQTPLGEQPGLPDPRQYYNKEHGWGLLDAGNAVREASYMWPVGVACAPDTTKFLLWNGNEHRAGYPTGGRFHIQRIGSSGNILSQMTHGPYPDYYAKAIAVGGDNLPVVLKSTMAGNIISLWKLKADCSFWYWYGYNGGTGARAVALAVAPDNSVRVLWDNSNGTISVWKLDANFNLITTTQVNAGYEQIVRAVDICVDSQGRSYVLVERSDGPYFGVVLLNANMVKTNEAYNLPSPTLDGGTDINGRWYSASKIAIGPNDQVRIMLNSLDGRFRVHTYPSPLFWDWGVSNPSPFIWESPYAEPFIYLDRGPTAHNWYPRFKRAPRALAVGPDNVMWMLMSGEDRKAYLWKHTDSSPVDPPFTREPEQGL